MKNDGHRFKRISEDEVACMDCGHEPWSMEAGQCPGPHRVPAEPERCGAPLGAVLGLALITVVVVIGLIARRTL